MCLVIPPVTWTASRSYTLPLQAGFELGFDHWGTFLFLGGQKFVHPSADAKGFCLLKFPTKIAEHRLLFIAQPCVIL